MTTTRPILLDLFCKQGGAGMGYHLADFDVVGVDIEAQPRYPFRFIQADAVDYAARHGWAFDIVHASPPCQAHSKAQRIYNRTHPDLITQIRDVLVASGRPYVIENVEDAPLLNPITLCGAMFEGLRTYRHRLFESNVQLTVPAHPAHELPLTKMGRPPQPGEFMHVVGNFSGVAQARQAMGASWMSREGLREAIPPAYTRFLGAQLLSHLDAGKAVAA
ncbi:DNA methylase [Nocardia sp. NPDC057030]|uniref:DNA methylase n=1 Tax=unclassified Nocardia TaxID=2637762 RepID=UPI00364167AA